MARPWLSRKYKRRWWGAGEPGPHVCGLLRAIGLLAPELASRLMHPSPSPRRRPGPSDSAVTRKTLGPGLRRGDSEGRALKEGRKADVLTSDALSAAFGMPMHVAKRGDYFNADVV